MRRFADLETPLAELTLCANSRRLLTSALGTAYRCHCQSFWPSIEPHVPDITSAAVMRTLAAQDDDGVNRTGYPPAIAESAGAEKLMP